jgi:hypothetical protein
MSKLVLFIGQSNGNGLFSWQSSTAALPDTFMWNGSVWVAPTGSGGIAYCNYLKSALNEPIYVVNACVDGLPLINGWTGTASGCAVDNAVANTQAAIAALPGCAGLDRIEFIGCNSDCVWPAQADMYTGTLNGLDNILGRFRTAFGDGFRFCVWPVGSASGGSMTQVVRAQVSWSTNSTSCARGAEVGPASYERWFADGNHWGDAAHAGVMGWRGGMNAASYFEAKANAADTIPHYGAGPQIVGIRRGGSPNRVLVDVRAKNGYGLMTADQWGSTSNSVSGFGLWWGEGSRAQLNVTAAYLLGSSIAVVADTGLAWRCAVGNHWERGIACSAPIYDTRGQPLVQHTSEMLTSN